MKLLSPVVIFLGSFLLFQIQPMMAKQLMPSFGGSASVWISCMLFFQSGLFFGYCYAWFLNRRLHYKTQLAVHLLLLIVSVLVLFPTAEPGSDIVTESPAYNVLIQLLYAIGLPYFILSSTSVLLQQWYANSSDNAAPYHWYALSNFGSLLALLTYPFIFEQHFSLLSQKSLWQIGFWLLAGVLGLLILLGYRTSSGRQNKMPNARILINWHWVLFAALASSLLMATTHMMTLNIPPVPFLWVLPLAIYLLSFIICFSNRNGYQRNFWMTALWIAVIFGLLLFFVGSQLPALVQIIVYSGILFVGCIFCHAELYQLRPNKAALSEFYLAIALGGLLSGIFVSLLAPVLFNKVIEYPLTLIGIMLLSISFKRRSFYPRLFATAVLAVVFSWLNLKYDHFNIHNERNFYGYIAVKDVKVGDINERRLVDGTTVHGVESLQAGQIATTSYYQQDSGVFMAINYFQQQSALHMGVIGLGAGVLAGHGKTDDVMHFYELNPAVVDAAKTHFSYLKNSRAELGISVGDGRLSLQQELNKSGSNDYNLLVIDAFSSDVIPVHLLTQEAFELYWQHLDREGLLAIHISNNHIDLKPVLQAAALTSGKHIALFSKQGNNVNDYGSEWVVMGSNKAFFEQYPAKVMKGLNPVIWTDQRNSILPLLKI